MSDFNRVRAMYGNATAWSGSDHADRPDLLALRESALAEFDEVMAQHDAEVRKAALNAAADDVPPSTPPLGGELAISEPVRMRFQQWLRARAGGAS
jgi:hypothetical protein